MEAVLGIERPRVGAAVRRRGAGKGTPRRGRRARGARRGAGSTSSATSRASTCRTRRGRRDRHRRLHRQRRPEGARGHGRRRCSRAIRDAAIAPAALEARRAAAPRRSAACATTLDPEERRRRDPARACASSVVVPHGSFGARGIAQRDRGSPARGVRGRGRAHARRLAAAGRCGGCREVRDRCYACSDDEPRRGPRPHPRRTWPTELEVDPGADRRSHALPGGPGRGLARPLRAGAWSSRTATGSACPTRRRRKIETVGQAADFVAAHAAERRP